MKALGTMGHWDTAPTALGPPGNTEKVPTVTTLCVVDSVPVKTLLKTNVSAFYRRQIHPRHRQSVALGKLFFLLLSHAYKRH